MPCFSLFVWIFSSAVISKSDNISIDSVINSFHYQKTKLHFIRPIRFKGFFNIFFHLLTVCKLFIYYQVLKIKNGVLQLTNISGVSAYFGANRSQVHPHKPNCVHLQECWVSWWIQNDHLSSVCAYFKFTFFSCYCFDQKWAEDDEDDEHFVDLPDLDDKVEDRDDNEHNSGDEGQATNTTVAPRTNLQSSWVHRSNLGGWYPVVKMQNHTANWCQFNCPYLF